MLLKQFVFEHFKNAFLAWGLLTPKLKNELNKKLVTGKLEINKHKPTKAAIIKAIRADLG